MVVRSKYLIWVAVSCLLVLSATAAFNCLIDPYNVFQLVTLPGINTSKSAVSNRTGLAKTYMVRKVAADTLIVGTSMFDIGMDPESKYLPERDGQAFNLAVPGSTVYEQYRYIQHAGAAHAPKLIIMSLEFQSFLSSREYAGNYPPVSGLERFEKRLNVNYAGNSNKYQKWQYLKDLSASVISNTATMDSIRTILEGDQEWIKPSGLSSGVARFGPEIRNKGYFSVFRNNLLLQAKNLPLGMVYPNTRSLHALDDIIGYCMERAISLVLVIPPSHVFQYELWDRANLWKEFEDWKQMLVQKANRQDAIGATVVIWDFAVYNNMTSEQVPPPHNASIHMRWYWDPVHFKATYGDLILKTCLRRTRIQ